jgi:hypothetical protein
MQFSRFGDSEIDYGFAEDVAVFIVLAQAACKAEDITYFQTARALPSGESFWMRLFPGSET